MQKEILYVKDNNLEVSIFKQHGTYRITKRYLEENIQYQFTAQTESEALDCVDTLMNSIYYEN